MYYPHGYRRPAPERRGGWRGHESILLEGSGGHTVRNVTSTLADDNIFVRSDHNQLINVYADSTINPAFNITGNHNRLTDSIARCDEPGLCGACVEVDGHENHLIDNFATSITANQAAPGGFGINGNNNVLRGNRAIVNEGIGIRRHGDREQTHEQHRLDEQH